MTTTLSDKLTSAEQFDSTPAGKALHRFKGAFIAALQNPAYGSPQIDASREAERALIEEIKRLQNQVKIEVVVHWRTDKAWLVESVTSSPEKVWIPRSMAELKGGDNVRKSGVLTLPEPFAVEKGLI